MRSLDEAVQECQRHPCTPWSERKRARGRPSDRRRRRSGRERQDDVASASTVTRAAMLASVVLEPRFRGDEASVEQAMHDGWNDGREKPGSGSKVAFGREESAVGRSECTHGQVEPNGVHRQAVHVHERANETEALNVVREAGRTSGIEPRNVTRPGDRHQIASVVVRYRWYGWSGVLGRKESVQRTKPPTTMRLRTCRTV